MKFLIPTLRALQHNTLKQNVRIHCFRHYSSQEAMPKQTEVVICGSGIVALSTAYHLMKKGISDVVILRSTRTKSTTVSGDYGSPLFRLKPYQEEAVLRESFALYKSLQDQGFDIGMENNGGLYLAQDNETMIRLKKRRDVLTHTSNLNIEVLGPREIKDKFPSIHTEDLKGGVVVHEDVSANALKIINALSSLSIEGGVKILSDCNLTKVVVKDGKVDGAETTKGRIKCQYFVNTTGCFAREMGKSHVPPVRIPVHSVLRHYLKTKPITQLHGINAKIPALTDYDSNMFMSKLQDDSVIIGAFEKNAKPVFTDGFPDDWAESDVIKAPVWDHFAPTLNAAIRRLPLLEKSEIDKFTCEPEPFSPDSLWIIGEAPEIQNYFVGAATCGNPMEVGGGMGAYLAHWIREGTRPALLLKFDILRFTAAHNCRAFLRDRVTETVSTQHTHIIPHLHYFKTARNVRCSPLFATLNECGAVHGETGAYEIPLYFDTKTPNLRGDILPPLTYFKPPYFDSLKREHQACIHAVGVCDTSAYAKFLISSPQNQVVNFLQKMCSNNVDIPVDHTCLTGMHNDQGGFEVDCLLGRLAINRYIMICPTILQNRAPMWIGRFMPPDNSIQLNDITSLYTILQLIGPKSRQLLSDLTRRDMNLRPFTLKIYICNGIPRQIVLTKDLIFKIQETNLIYAPGVFVLNFTNTAEPGYSLFIPTEYALSVYNKVIQVGKDYGTCNVGFFTHRILRMERRIGIWGDDIHDNSTPAEVGRLGRVDFKKDFKGRAAMIRQQEEGVHKRLGFFTLSADDEDFSIERDPWPVGGEPICRNGIFVGQVTSVTYGFREKVMMVHAFITNPKQKNVSELGTVTKEYIADKEALYHIDLAGKRCKLYPHTALMPADFQ